MLQMAAQVCVCVWGGGASFAYVVRSKCPLKDSKKWNHLHYEEQNIANASHKEISYRNIAY